MTDCTYPEVTGFRAIGTLSGVKSQSGLEPNAPDPSSAKSCVIRVLVHAGSWLEQIITMCHNKVDARKRY